MEDKQLGQDKKKIGPLVTGVMTHDGRFITANAWNEYVWDVLPGCVSINGKMFLKGSWDASTKMGYYNPQPEGFVVGFSVYNEEGGFKA